MTQTDSHPSVPRTACIFPTARCIKNSLIQTQGSRSWRRFTRHTKRSQGQNLPPTFAALQRCSAAHFSRLGRESLTPVPPAKGFRGQHGRNVASPCPTPQLASPTALLAFYDMMHESPSTGLKGRRIPPRRHTISSSCRPAYASTLLVGRFGLPQLRYRVGIPQGSPGADKKYQFDQHVTGAPPCAVISGTAFLTTCLKPKAILVKSAWCRYLCLIQILRRALGNVIHPSSGLPTSPIDSCCPVAFPADWESS